MDIAASIEIPWFSNVKPSDASRLPQWPWTWDLQGGLLPAALGSTLCSNKDMVSFLEVFDITWLEIACELSAGRFLPVAARWFMVVVMIW